MKKYSDVLKMIFAGWLIFSFNSCNEKVLNEVPLAFLSPDNSYTSKAAFDNGIYALYDFARGEQTTSLSGESMIYEMSLGTDVGEIGEHFAANSTRFWDYSIITSSYIGARAYWNWAYQGLISNANVIITRAENPDIVWTATEKAGVIAEAKFFRAYAYNILVNLFGGVPIVTEELTAPKVDFVRASRQEVLEQIEKDLVDAEAGLPDVEVKDGRINKATAQHLLSEVYISLGVTKNDASYYDKSIAAATKVISNPRYKLMTARFGANKDKPGDVFHDLFWDYNMNRGSGNTETIWNFQFEEKTTGGGLNWSTWVRAWGPRYFENLPFKAEGSMRIVDDTLGRPVAWVRGTNHVFYGVWNGNRNDMRNSKYNMIRKFYYNQGPKKGMLIVPDATTDTMFNYYPYIGKLQGDFLAAGIGTGYSPKDIYRMRLAETYLLRGEAYWRKGDLVNAAADINVVRARANATPVQPSAVNRDFILDERIRELVVEEPRVRTLHRFGDISPGHSVFYDRVSKYNYSSSTGWGAKVQEYNSLWPIPQEAIDANFGATLEQNPGYQ